MLELEEEEESQNQLCTLPLKNDKTHTITQAVDVEPWSQCQIKTPLTVEIRQFIGPTQHEIF